MELEHRATFGWREEKEGGTRLMMMGVMQGYGWAAFSPVISYLHKLILAMWMIFVRQCQQEIPRSIGRRALCHCKFGCIVCFLIGPHATSPQT